MWLIDGRYGGAIHHLPPFFAPPRVWDLMKGRRAMTGFAAAEAAPQLPWAGRLIAASIHRASVPLEIGPCQVRIARSMARRAAKVLKRYGAEGGEVERAEVGCRIEMSRHSALVFRMVGAAR